MQSDSFRVTPLNPVVKTFEIPVGNPYTVEVGFNPTVDRIEWHFGISNCLPILGFTCLDNDNLSSTCVCKYLCPIIRSHNSNRINPLWGEHNLIPINKLSLADGMGRVGFILLTV